MTEISIAMVGDGWARLQIDAPDLEEVAERLRRDRSLTARLLMMDGQPVTPHAVLIPAHRIALISEAFEADGGSWSASQT